MAHDPNKKQRLSEFDFTSEDAHVAIVGKAANGKEKFLVTKKFNADSVPVNKALDAYTQMYIDNLIADAREDELEQAKADKVYVEMSLEDLLRNFCHVWGDQAKEIAASVIMKSVTDDKKDALRKALLAKMPSGSDRSGAADNTEGQPSTIEKSQVENMTDKAPEQEVINKAVQEATASQAAVIAELQKSLDGLKAKDEAAELAKYEVVAKSLGTLGATVDHAKVLKAVAAIDGGKDVLDMLTKAVALISKGDALNEKGTSLGADSEDKPAKLAAIAKSLVAADASKTLTFAQAMVTAAEQHPELL